MPHVPLFVSEKFKNKSERGLYGDVIEEIDWYTGAIIQALKDKKLDKNTIIIFTSDNGPWLGYKADSGNADPLRDGKFTNYEGGVRVPCIMSWPGRWDQGKVSDEIVSSVDFFPTIANYAGAKFNNVHGIDISSLLENSKNKLDRDYVLYRKRTEVHGIRKGDWKYLPYGGARNSESTKPSPELYNLKEDVSESANMNESRPDLVQKLELELKSIMSNLNKNQK